ncbi:MAG: DUF3137 domain-containing protein [Saprospiraceae bacterium]|nr:DUF3137 domain-containing protein [Saprospiraceae bacterium]MCB0542790.1 DUF3137 domain-containing protein [Saprospiraceae bacterium]MCB0574253.1 DUF3137 domain-containing protein [Saprospiraceae bacterium]MCB9305295.1 DUF3137 domain-containing protein [Lewinellaceae bacterium]MCB9356061.1 DUF3137 domain-containing protein [Lewinellaceae bacterium]
MDAYRDFRLFYNQNIHPELLHMEQRRRRLIRLLGLSALMIAGVVAVQLFMGIFLLSLLLAIPVAMWVSYLGFRIRVFFQEFKPRVVGLLLDFIDNDVNFTFEGYDSKGSISKNDFLESRIFTTADDYAGEDMIRGQVRETPFELCELRVREFSPARNKLDYVFRGIFLIGDYKRWDLHGGVLVLPDAYRKYLSRSERAFHYEGGRRVRDNLLPEFEAFFDTYATSDIRVQDVISTDLQHVILDFRRRFQEKNRQKEIYFSIIGDKIYLALTQDKDLLEPSLFANNANFETVVEFYNDLRLLLQVVLDVDAMN